MILGKQRAPAAQLTQFVANYLFPGLIPKMEMHWV